MMNYLIVALLLMLLILQIISMVKRHSGGNGSLEAALREESRLSRSEQNQIAALNREEVAKSLHSMETSIRGNLDSISKLQLEQLAQITSYNQSAIDKLSGSMEEKMEKLSGETKEQLEKMRAVVDEKLHRTLEERLDQSFLTVSKRLESVQNGLGEMKQLAQGVGDLKKVLSNVKTRGILGELQLKNLLEQIFSPAQYDTNVATKPGSRDVVEFAIKIPQKGGYIYLPIDAKFPIADFQRMNQAAEQGDELQAEQASKELEVTIKRCAKDIRDKYISPPHTTEFGILFLPIEGLYAEIARRTGLLEQLQSEYHIMIAGPTTIGALLTALQLGFRTFAIEQRATDVWKTLAAVKVEFTKFADTLNAAQRHIIQVGDDIDKLVGVRTKKIMQQLEKAEDYVQEDTTTER